GPRDADALLHAAGELRRPLVLGAGETDEVDEFLRLVVEIVLAHEAPFRRHRVGDIAHDREPREQRVALEDYCAVEARAFDRLIVDDPGALPRLLEPRMVIEHRGLAAAGVADDADEFAARHRQPQLLERRRAAANIQLAYSIARVMTGSLIAVAVAIPIGFLIGMSPLMSRARNGCVLKRA